MSRRRLAGVEVAVGMADGAEPAGLRAGAAAIGKPDGAADGSIVQRLPAKSVVHASRRTCLDAQGELPPTVR